jgi:hypothetical protein
MNNQTHIRSMLCNFVHVVEPAPVRCDDSTVMFELVWAQGMHQTHHPIVMAIHVCIQLAKVMVQKANPMSQAPLSSVPTRNILYGSIFVRVQYCQPDVHAQTTLAFVPNKIRQT